MKRAFTLIELLVVIAIIAILAAILFPVFAQAKESAKKTAALAQMKQLGIAVQMYLNDTDDVYVPCTNYDAATTDPARIWEPGLFPYVKDKNIFILPGSQAKYPTSWGTRHGASIGMNANSAIDMTAGCADGDVTTKNCEGWKGALAASAIDKTSQYVLFASTPDAATKADGTPNDATERRRGYSFSPDNGVEYSGGKWPMKTIDEAVPLVSDQDLFTVTALASRTPAQMKPIWCRYGKGSNDQGQSPFIFGDTHAKVLSAARVRRPNTDVAIWRVR